MEDELPGGSGGVYVLFDREEGNSAATEVFESLDELLLDGAGGPVKALDNNDIEPPLGRICQESAEAYPIVPHSRSDVAVGFYQLQALGTQTKFSDTTAVAESFLHPRCREAGPCSDLPMKALITSPEKEPKR